MKTFIFSIVVLGSLSVKAEIVDTCYSQCLGVSTYSNTLRFLGNLSSIGSSRLNSWRELNQKCKFKARQLGLDPILAQGTFVYEADHSWSSYSWYSASAEAVATFRYARATAHAEGGSSVYQNDVMKLKVEFADPGKGCFREDIDLENNEDYYDGDLPVQG